MGTVLWAAACDSCGGRHDFWLGYGDLMPSRGYRYVCPVTAAEVEMHPTAGGEKVAGGPPPAAVRLDASSRRRV